MCAVGKRAQWHIDDVFMDCHHDVQRARTFLLFNVRNATAVAGSGARVPTVCCSAYYGARAAGTPNHVPLCIKPVPYPECMDTCGTPLAPSKSLNCSRSDLATTLKIF